MRIYLVARILSGTNGASLYAINFAFTGTERLLFDLTLTARDDKDDTSNSTIFHWFLGTRVRLTRRLLSVYKKPSKISLNSRSQIEWLDVVSSELASVHRRKVWFKVHRVLWYSSLITPSPWLWQIVSLFFKFGQIVVSRGTEAPCFS